MGDRTVLDRVIDLECAVRDLRDEIAGIRVLVSCVKIFTDGEALRKAKIAERMAKARAGRGKSKG